MWIYRNLNVILLKFICFFLLNKNHLDTNTIIQQTKSPKHPKKFAIRAIKFHENFLSFKVYNFLFPKTHICSIFNAHLEYCRKSISFRLRLSEEKFYIFSQKFKNFFISVHLVVLSLLPGSFNTCICITTLFIGRLSWVFFFSSLIIQPIVFNTKKGKKVLFIV